MNFFPAQAPDLCYMENNKSIEKTILTYTSAWNETEREAVLEKISKCWAPGGAYTDHLTDTITGPEAITDLIISSYRQMGPRTFQVLAQPQVHHQSGRFRWLAVRPEGYPIEGMDYFEFDSENRITRIVGFF
ncbi:nuclear transport factor 2 family protein [Mucilaginibacter sp. UR6-1]|uniref:nuclear transport factor 2 family protein n=1 Tax=Mucilaginibacter sp. UR6-1 TaxID=1435643 RepID=UPI001E3D50DB|nr:nuclear transport factor 2 family protein [Mucilaginibacter sp. UR6-1]MCC8409157.1 nuclear transport factor 2 family protein [Mucilaginibacter sp. UR6-1]